MLRLRQIPVMLSKCGINSGACDKECATLDVTEHIKCACSCPLSENSCSPAQHFRPELCACQCKDRPARQACLDTGRLWNDDTCSCGCVTPKDDCAPGEVFSMDKYGCIDEDSIIGANILNEDDKEKSGKDSSTQDGNAHNLDVQLSMVPTFQVK